MLEILPVVHHIVCRADAHGSESGCLLHLQVCTIEVDVDGLLACRNVDVRHVWQGRHDWHGCYGRHQRQFDTRTGVFDVWNIRLYLWQFRLLHRFYFWTDGRSLWIWLLRSLRFCKSFRNQDWAYRHLRLHGNRFLRLFRSCICWWRLRLRHLRAHISLKLLVFFPYALHILIVVGKYGVAELVVIIQHRLS